MTIREKHCEFIDWLNSPEGMRYFHCGIENFVYEKNASGKFQYTELGWNAFTTNANVPGVRRRRLPGRH